jgi:WD40 repeat protein
MMFDRSLVTSGFDTETLISEKYLSYLLLAQVEAGLLELQFDVVKPPATNLSVTLHPPPVEDYETVYQQSEDPPIPSREVGSFGVELLPGEDSGFVDVAFSPDGAKLLTRSFDSRVRIWDIASRRQDESLSFEVTPALGSAFNPAATLIAAASADHSVHLWDIAARAPIAQLAGHGHVVECVAFSADGQRLVSGSFDKTARIWDLATGNSLHTLGGHGGRVMCVTFDQSGTRVATGCEDHLVRIWDAQSGALLHTLTGHTGPVNCLAFSHNDQLLVSGSDDKTMQLWNPLTGALIRTYNQHTDAVISVAFGLNDVRIVSGSRDNSMRLWSVNGNNALAVNSDHRSDVMRVCFFGNTATIASVSAGASIRTWDALDPRKVIEIRLDFMLVKVAVTIVDHADTNGDGVPDEKVTTGTMGLIVYLALNADIAANGLETNHRLRISFGRFDDATKFVLTQTGQDVPGIEASMRETLDRDLPLGIAQGQQVQQIRMRKFFDGDSPTLGIYVDLGLRKGPGNDFREPRGVLALAQNFREQGKNIAFATSPGLFALLGPDAKFQRAERAGSGFRFPLRKDPSDSSSDEIGTIDSISVGPEIVPMSSLPTGRLMVNVDATYTDSTPDVGFSVQMFFRPKRDSNSIVNMESDMDIDFGLLATLLFLAAGLAVLFVYMAPFGIAFWLIAGSMATLVGQGIAEHVVSKKLAESVDEESQATVVDSMPFRLPAATRRWDPFYDTAHQIVARLDENMVIDRDGIAFEGSGLVLDKQPQIRDDISPVDETRDSTGVTAVRYEVPDFARFATDITEAKGPGVDRLNFLRADPVNHPTWVTLTVDEILDRKAQKRVLAPIVLDARRINLDGGQIDQLLCCTWRVRTQERNRLINEFRSRRHDEIEAEVRADFAAAGETPTEEEVSAETDKRFEEIITDEQKEYEGGALRDDLHAALAPLLRFDVAPEELVTLENIGIFSLDGKEIIVRHNKNGIVTPYYRDRPDGDPRDNLLSLPHYSFPYAPPP